MSRRNWRASGVPKKISFFTERGMSNSFQNDFGGTMIAWHSTRIMIGTFNDSRNFCLRLSRGTRLRRYSWANEMWRASSATWIAITRSMIGCSALPSRSTFFWV